MEALSVDELGHGGCGVQGKVQSPGPAVSLAGAGLGPRLSLLPVEGAGAHQGEAAIRPTAATCYLGWSFGISGPPHLGVAGVLGSPRQG